ncbi:MAG: DUF2341 domain-containing protein [Candidatus Parvarchaeum sp.]
MSNFLVKKKAQSALEYMMTYGWAILIIVIVAVILYSMGIFNPSSSVTFTSSGFTPFTVSSVICTQDGLSFSVLAGPIPNNANSAEINKVFITSATGANETSLSFTILNPVQLSSGESSIIVIPGIACKSTGTKVSIAANLQYTYTIPSIGVQTVNATGTLAGTSSSGPTLPSEIEYYSPITVKNSQSTATSQPFQQLVNITSSNMAWSYITPDGNFGQNVEFFYQNGTVIPSWLENYTANHAIWWLKLPAIPASSSITVYMGFAPTTTNLFNNVNDGEAPQLSSTYAEYDDGANVFNFYDNFAGTSLNSNKWQTSVGTGWVVSVNNGLTISGSGSSSANSVYVNSVNAVINTNQILEGYINQGSGSTYNERGMIGASSSNTVAQLWDNGGSSGDTIAGWCAGKNDVPNIIQSETVLNGAYTYLQSISSNSNLNIYSIAITSSAVSTWYNYGGATSTTSNVPTAPLYVSLSVTSIGGGAAVNMFYQWVRVRAYPPNGVMPSVTFGSVS